MVMIRVENLTKEFEYYEKGTNFFKRKKITRRVVSDISFEINEGEFVAFIGPNGAGKTTTLKMLSGILHPTFGKIVVNSFIPSERKDEFKRSFALVAGQKSQLWIDLPAIDSFYLNKCIYDISDDDFKETLEELSEMLNVKKN